MTMPTEFDKETRILNALKQVLTRIAKETATPPGVRHPLSETCIEDIRQCLLLISAREHELNVAAGTPSEDRPRFIDEPRSQGPTVISIDQIKGRRKDTQ